MVAALASILTVALLSTTASAEPAPLAYITHVSGDADPAVHLPLIVAVHGLGDRPEHFVHLFDGYDGAARIVVPRAPTSWGNGYSWFAIAESDEHAFARGVADAAAQLAGLVAQLESSFPTRGKAVITGFSQGGMLSFTVAALYGDRIQAAVPISGLLPRGLDPTCKSASVSSDDASAASTRTPAATASGTPVTRASNAKACRDAPRIRALHGAIDNRVPYSAAKQSIERLVAAGFDAELSTYDGVGHSVSPEMRADLHRILRRLTGDAPSPAAAAESRTAETPPAAH